MADGSWFDNLTRALAASGDRRGFLRLLAGGVAGTALGALLPDRGEAAPAAQVTCSPRPRVVVSPTTGFDQITVVLRATGQNNTVKKVTFSGLRNAVVDVAGVATGAGDGFSYTPPAGATQTTFSVRAVDGTLAVHAPFVVNDACPDGWRSFVGAGAGTLRNTARVCTSGATTLAAPAPAGTTTLQVANQSCFKVGDTITLDPGGAGQETLQVAGFGSVITRTPTTRAHPAGTPVFRRPATGETCGLGHLVDPCASTGESCCAAEGQPAGRGVCCPFGYCCDKTDGVLGGEDAVCVDDSFYRSNMQHCGSCGNICADNSDRCVNGQCRCGSGPACPFDEGVCLRGTCCNSPNVVCGPSTNRQCCNDTTHYCTLVGSGSDSICCPKTRAACGNFCCATNQFCDGSNQCTICPCGTETWNRATNSCYCGTPGTTCNTAEGKRCTGGQCVCAADPGYKLAFYSCTFDPVTRTWEGSVKQCHSSFATICKRTTPSPDPEIFPEYSCSSSGCSGDYVPMDPLCERPA